MSRRKKYYDKTYEYNNLNPNQYFSKPYIQDNLYNMFNMLGNMDFKNLNNMMSLISNGFDINNVNFDKFYYENTEENKNPYINEIIVNFFTSLKPILGSEFGNIIDKFIEFYMNEINKEDNR